MEAEEEKRKVAMTMSQSADLRLSRGRRQGSSRPPKTLPNWAGGEPVQTSPCLSTLPHLVLRVKRVVAAED